MAEASALNTREHHQLVVAILDFRQQQGAAGLSDGFDDQHARHNRQVGEVPREEWLVYRDILDRYNALLAREIDDAVNQQEGMAVWQNAQDLIDIQRRLGGWRGFG